MRALTRWSWVAVSMTAVFVAARPARALNPQPLPPRVAGLVRDACTGLPIAGATVSLVPETPGVAGPAPSTTGAFGGFLVSNLVPGVYDFAVAATGYDPIEKNPGPPGTPGEINPGPIQLTLDPAPSGVLAGEGVSETVFAAVSLAPAAPGAVCGRNPGPVGVPSLSGVVRNALTGLAIPNAVESLTPTTGEKDPGPSQFSFLGRFSWPTLDPGGYALGVAAPGFIGFGDPASVNPGPAQVTINPGPVNYPDGGSLAFGTAVDILLVPVS
jgi:hypothetical protein